MKAFRYILLSLLLCMSAACSADNGQNDEASTDLSPIVVSRICQTAEGKPYLEVDDKPFPVYGAQIRVDIFRSVDKLDWDEIELYFATAQDLGVNSVQVSYPWAFLEPKRDQYSFTEIDKIMELANEYDLKVELLWFSTNMIGDSYTWLVPTYILAESAIRLKRTGDGSHHYLYGYTYSIIMDDEWVLEREVKAVRRLFTHIREWDEANGRRHPLA